MSRARRSAFAFLQAPAFKAGVHDFEFNHPSPLAYVVNFSLYQYGPLDVSKHMRYSFYDRAFLIDRLVMRLL